MPMARHFPAVEVSLRLAEIASGADVLYVIADSKHYLVGGKPLLHEAEREAVCHLAHHQPCLGSRIRLLQDLARADAACARPVLLDIPDRAGFPAPGMVNQQLGIDAEEPV